MTTKNHLFGNAYRTKCALLLALCLSISQPGWSQSKPDLQNSVSNSRRSAIVNAVEDASPAVVNINTVREVVEYVRRDSGYWSPFFSDSPFLYRQRTPRRGLGSGVIFNQAGYVLTNQHVIEDADTTKVILSDGREYEARIVGEDFLSDLAVLQIDAADLSEIKQGDSDDLMIGEWAIAIGHPFALAVGNPKPTVTIGVISATDRVLKTENRHYHNLIQTDASINPGNSGGPLVNLYGELVGINTAIYSTSGGSQGIGFAIPANDAKQIVSQLIAYGSVVPPYIGISVQDLPQEIAEDLKLDGSIGVLVSAVDDKSPAKKAGIRRGDVIQAINQQPILNSEETFRSITRLLNKDQTVTFQVFRRGNRENLHLKIEELQWRFELPGWGITVEQLDLESARKYRLRGVVVAKINRRSTLARRGLKRGDLIFQISNNPIRSVEDFKLTISELRQNQRISIHFERDGKRDALYDLIIQR
ncbi:MAG: trypsin-like peptidase domain-containing protein [Candidatus Poribacteria bacterium]|nr:trypsin-like peptidase domain-containing protein [Candidatus Poribacteria bacterium]